MPTSHELIQLKRELQNLRTAIGSPTYDELAEQTKLYVPRVWTIINDEHQLGDWSVVSKVVQVMHGDMHYFYALWLAAKDNIPKAPNNTQQLAEIVRIQENMNSLLETISGRLGIVLEQMKKAGLIDE